MVDTMDYDAASRYYEGLIGEYLRATSAGAVDETVARFVTPMREVFAHDPDPESSIEGMLWTAWDHLIMTARESSGTVQDRLVDLLTGIERQGVLTRDGGRQECVIWGDLKVFADLPCFGALMRETWDMGWGQPGYTEFWVNMNAFAARLTAAGVDFALYAIWTLRECLEDGPSADRADLRAIVPWFQHCGTLLARLAHQREPSYEGAPAGLGELCRARGMTEGGFTVERWEFWRSRLADRETGTDAAAEAARAALRHMPALD